MKLPEQLRGAQRMHHRGRTPRVAPSAQEAGVVPQDAWCEDTCWEAYEDGSDAQQECLEACWDN